ALVWDSIFMIIGVMLLYKTASERFIASINALAGTPGYLLPVAPFYNLMASIAANNSIFALLIAVSFLFWNLPAMFPNTFMPVRTIFAWSFDRILPSRLSDVSERTMPQFQRSLLHRLLLRVFLHGRYSPARLPHCSLWAY
ncbi:MAG: hypothetical protein ACXVCM_24535, partial [Ktedonobacteraceae bacterium]